MGFSTLHRRQFLLAAGGAAGVKLTVQKSGSAAPGTSPALVSGKNVNSRIRAAVVGCRGRGWQLMECLHQLGPSENVEVAAVCEVDASVLESRLKRFEDLAGRRPKTCVDIRMLLEDGSIDVVFHATPNHWHALGGIWTVQAGKDAYVEKPMSHNIWEGRKLVEAARKHQRIVQHGTQCRSSPVVLEAVRKMREGLIGELFMARGCCFKYRKPVYRTPPSDPPRGVNYDLWVGPAPMKPFRQHRFHYNWHWQWDFGAGDIGNMGIHQLDLLRMGLGLDEHPVEAMALGGKFVHNDDRETPNVHTVLYRYGGRDVQVEMAVRGVTTNFEARMGTELPFRLGKGHDIAGVIFSGSEGYLVIPDYSSYYTFLGLNRTPGPKRVDEEDLLQNLPHIRNFLHAVRSRRRRDLTADVEEGHKSATLAHLGNISYRLGRTVRFDPKNERFENEDANRLLKREYRAPYVVPEEV